MGLRSDIMYCKWWGCSPAEKDYPLKQCRFWLLFLHGPGQEKAAELKAPLGYTDEPYYIPFREYRDGTPAF